MTPVKPRVSTLAALSVLALLAIGGLCFVVSSSLAAMYQLPIWSAAVIGALSFPLAGLLWHLVRERARRGRAPGWLTRRARFALRQLVVCGVILGACFGVAEPQTRQALLEHRGWIVGYTQARTEEGCEVRGGHHPHWGADVDEGLARAAELDKPALLYFRSDWCHYCEEFERDVLCAPEVAETIDRDYVGVRINELDMSPEVKARFHVTGYPRTLLLGPDLRPRSNGPSKREREATHEWLLRNRVSPLERLTPAPPPDSAIPQPEPAASPEG